MGKIHVLDKALAELIAAGEVVERPASIAKELIENAIDAGATAITVEIERGGISLLRVSDNGSGIPREEIPTAFLRHATSKVRTQSDLEAILTLGFRGEALASIAAMSRVELLSKTAGEEEGSLYRIEGGEELSLEPAGCPVGTVLTIRDVFYNTPARMKFLKKDVGEGNAVAQVVDKCALSHPEVSFRFVRDGKVRLQTSGAGELLPVISAVYGKEFATGMIPVNHELPLEGIKVTGYVTAPSAGRPSRAYQNFFLNARYVRSRTAAAAVEEAFKTLIGHGKYPGCVLQIDIAPGLVDVNVHPAKIEVRFVNERPVFQSVYFAVKSALAACQNGIPLQKTIINPQMTQPAAVAAPAPQERMTSANFLQQFAAKKPQVPPVAATSNRFESTIMTGQKPREDSFFHTTLAFHSPQPDIYVRPEEGNPAHPWKISQNSSNFEQKPSVTYSTIERDAENPEENTTVSTELPSPEPQEALPEQTAIEETSALRLIGELDGTYILLEQQGNLVLVDKHAAHERILYEKLKKEIAYGNRQVLLTPLTLELSRDEAAALLEQAEQVEALGFLVEDFGGGSVLVREVPLEMGERDIALLLGDIAAKLLLGRQDITPDALDRLYYNIACKAAVRARDKNALPELAALVDKLAEHPQITHCPHGRPVQVTLTGYDIEKMFGRQG